MVRFRQEVSIEPLSRRWLEDVVDEFHDAVERLDVAGERFSELSGGPEIRPLDEQHITTGTRYTLRPFDLAARLKRNPSIDDETASELGRDASADETPSEAVIISWDREVETGIRLTSGEGPDSVVCTIKLRSARRPGNVMMHYVIKESNQLVREITFLTEIDLEHWWRRLDGHVSRTPAVTTRVTHHLLTGTLTIAPHAAADGRWGLAVTVAGRGRSWARPLAALAVVVFRGALRRAVTKEIIDAAHAWDRTVVDMRAESPSDAARRILANALAPPEEQS